MGLSRGKLGTMAEEDHNGGGIDVGTLYYEQLC